MRVPDLQTEEKGVKVEEETMESKESIFLFQTT